MKILFLIQSCNQERYIKEEQIIRETWAKRLRKNCDLYFYRGGYEESTLSDDTLLLKCDDSLDGTFIKTIMAFKVFENKNYDFIVRVNTSTWINVDLLLDTLETFDATKRELYGGFCLQNNTSYSIPFLRGNLLIFNKTVFSDLMKLTERKLHIGIDDACIGINLFKYYKENKIDYLKTLKIIPVKQYKIKSKIGHLGNVIAVWCSLYIKEKNDSSILLKIDKQYTNSLKVATPQKVNVIETVFGELNL